VRKGITVRGAGIDRTVLIDDVADTFMLGFTTVNGESWRLSNMTLRGGTAAKNSAGMIDLNGNAAAFRIDHAAFVGWQAGSGALTLSNDLRGVIDHCDFDSDGIFVSAITIYHDKWKGVGADGDNSWADGDNLGTGDFVFIEDSAFRGVFASAIVGI